MKVIRLTQNLATVVDDEDFDFLNQFSWHTAKCNYGICYARTFITYRTEKLCKEAGKNFSRTDNINMHKLLIDIPSGSIVDHINNDSLDNRKENLRICTHKQNTQNKKLKEGQLYKGVYVREQKNGRNYYSVCRKFLGTFYTPEEAAKAFDKKAIDVYGEFACTNFPKEEYAVHTIHP